MPKHKTIKKHKTHSVDVNHANNGMLTRIWGPPLWHCLHTISFNYPIHPTESQKKKYKAFILSFQDVLPCGKCRVNLKANLKNHPPEAKWFMSRESFSKYIYLLHEVVNTMLHKKSNLSYARVRDIYETFRAKCSVPELPSPIDINTSMPSKPESGCTVPVYNKSRCILNIVPDNLKTKTRKSISIDPRCKCKYKKK